MAPIKAGKRKTVKMRGRRQLPILSTMMIMLVAAVICSTLWYSTSLPSDTFPGNETEYKLPTVTGWLVNSSSCQLPDYDPWDESIAHVIKNDTPFHGCRQDYPVTIQQQGDLLMLASQPAEDDRCRMECCYRSVSRASEGFSDDNYKFGFRNDCFQGKKVLKVSEEFIHVQCFCQTNNVVVYEDFRAFIVAKPNASSSPRTIDQSGDRLNVYLIVLDSVSRLNFKRFLPNVEKLLADDFDAIPMLGLTKIGVNTFPNMLAVLAGMRMDAIQSLRNKPFDGLPFVWKHFSKLGFETMFNEDNPELSTFNYLKQGFHITPTDYYLRPVYRAIYDSRFVKSKETLCINQRAEIDLQLQWLEDWMARDAPAPQFALLFSSALSHWGPLPYVNAMQGRLVEFLRRYRNSDRYNASIVFLFSDHGMRFGPIMRHELGGYESRLPFFYVLLPPWYAARHPFRVASLRANSARLTTFFDAHATLRDLLRDAGAAEADLPPLITPGVSLFQPVPPDRSCDAAGISPHWCMCRARRPLPRDDAVIGRAAAAAVRHVNSRLLRRVRAQCAELLLMRVTAAFHTLSQHGGAVLDTEFTVQPFEEYVVRFVTEPGMAELEATVRTSRGRHGEEVTVVDVSRLNLYRGQSDCLKTQWDERRFCYCRDLL